MLSKEEIAVVESCGMDFDYKVVWTRVWGGDIIDREPVVRDFLSNCLHTTVIAGKSGAHG